VPAVRQKLHLSSCADFRDRLSPIQFRPKDWFGFFERRGWKVGEVRYLIEEGELLGRPIPLPFLMKVWIRLARTFASRAHLAEMKRLASVLLVPN